MYSSFCLSDYVNIGICAIIQGFTEFLPVSSTMHVMLVAQFFHFIPQYCGVFGTAMAPVIFYKTDFINFWHQLCQVQQRVISIILSSCIGLVVCVIIVLLKKYQNHTWLYVSDFLMFAPYNQMLAGSVLYLSTLCKSKHYDLHTFRWMDAIILGLSNGFGVFPGFSRYGCNLTVLMLRGYDIKSAIYFTIISQIPLSFATAIHHFCENIAITNILHVKLGDLLTYQWLWLLIMEFIAYTCSYIILSYTQASRWTILLVIRIIAIYRIVLGLFLC